MKLTFMGTAGARFMVAKQLAASGGLYLEDGNARIALDPGPGAIVQYAKRKVDLTKLDAIVVSHRHLDHAGDVNVMVEAMTEGGFAHRGRLFCPSDALDDDPVVLMATRRVTRCSAAARATFCMPPTLTARKRSHGAQACTRAAAWNTRAAPANASTMEA